MASRRVSRAQVLDALRVAAQRGLDRHREIHGDAAYLKLEDIDVWRHQVVDVLVGDDEDARFEVLRSVDRHLAALAKAGDANRRVTYTVGK